MAKKLRRPGQLSKQANEMRNIALAASEATNDFARMNPIELAMSWTNAENILAPWGSGVKSQINFFEGHAMDFPMSSDSLNSVIKDAANKAKVELGLDKLGIEPTVQINYGVNEQIMKNSMDSINLGSYVPNDSMIRINVDSIWDTVKNDGGSTMDDLIERVTETVSHEMRHMYQFEGKNKDKWDKKDSKWKQKKIKKNMPDTYDTWLRDPIEKDAVAYQKKFTRRNVNDIKNNLLNRQTREYELLQRQLQKEQPFKRGEGTWRIADNNFDYSPTEFDLNDLDIPNSPIDHRDVRNINRGQGRYRNNSDRRLSSKLIDNSSNASSGPNISDLDPETLANLTDEEIIEWATNNEELNQAIDLRTQARKNLGMDAAPEIETTGKNTEINTQLNNNFNGGKPNNDETIEEKIKRLTEEESKRFERESQADFDKRMKKIEEEFNQEAKRIEKEFGPRIENAEKKSRKDRSPNRSRKEKLETAGKRLKNKKISKPNKSTRFKPKGDNLNEIIVNTMVSSAVNTASEAAEETIEKATGEATKTIFENTKTQREKILEDPEGYIESFFNDYENRQHEGYNDKNKYLNEDGSSNINNYEFEANDNPQENFKYPEGYTGKETDFYVDSEGNTTINKTNKTKSGNFEANKKRESFNTRLATSGDADIFDWMKNHKIGILDIGFNLFGAIGDYKDSRRKGHGVVSSTVRAAASFAVGEMLGFWGGIGVMAFKELPKLAIKGTELLYKENRKMNSAANNQVFGGAQFYDTQQLATMRQSGMEMAKMAQYNLQQTLMGNEATHLHR